VKNLAAPTFNGAEGARVRRDGKRQREVGALGKVPGGDGENAEGLDHFVDAHEHPMEHVAFLIDRDAEGEPVVGGVRMIAADVEVDAGGAACDANDAQFAGSFGAKDAGPFEAVAGGIGGIDEGREGVEFALDDAEGVAEAVDLGGAPGAADAANADHAAEPARTGEAFVHAEDEFADAAGVGVGDNEADVRGDGADIADVVGKALELEQNGAHHTGARRDAGTRGGLNGLAEGGAVRKSGIAGDAFGEEHGTVNGHVLEELLGGLVGIEHAQLQVQDGFAGDGETEMAGLNDAGVDRADGDLKDAFAKGGAVDVALAFEGR